MILWDCCLRSQAAPEPRRMATPFHNIRSEPSKVRFPGPDFGWRSQLTSLERPDLKDRPFLPQAPPALLAKDGDFFAAIPHEDMLLHHPFDSFQPVIEFLQRAARDPAVLAIKMTLYRLGRDSPVVGAFLRPYGTENKLQWWSCKRASTRRAISNGLAHWNARACTWCTVYPD